MCSGITNNCKLLKGFALPKTEQSYRFVWSGEFPWVFYSRQEDGTYCLSFLFFVHKNVESFSLENLLKNPKMVSGSKDFEKTSKCCNENTQKESRNILQTFT